MQMGSEEFRNNWGENVERVLSGVVITIQRYSRPAMVMMPYTKYKEMADRLAQFEAAVADGTRTEADPEFAAAVLQLAEKVEGRERVVA